MKKGNGVFVILGAVLVLCSFFVIAASDNSKGGVVIVPTAENGSELHNASVYAYQNSNLIWFEEFSVDTKILLTRGTYDLVVARADFLNETIPINVTKGVLFVEVTMHDAPIVELNGTVSLNETAA